MNKKADAEGIGMIFSIIFLIIILFLFYSFSFIDKGIVREETSEQIDLSNININLLSLLRTEVNEFTISELIIDCYSKDDYSKLSTEVNNIFQDYFDKNYCWALIIIEGDKVLAEINNLCGGKPIESIINIPTPNTGDLTIKLIRYGAEKSNPTYSRDIS